MDFRTLLLRHYEAFPKLQLEDIFKFLHQGTFGPGHLIASAKDAEEGILREMEKAEGLAPYPIESLGTFSRVPLALLNPKTMAKLLFLSAKAEAEEKETLPQKLEMAKALIKEKILPFSLEDFNEKAKKWEAEGFPPVHHSEAFRAAYSPSYRVLKTDLIPFLPLFREIDKRLSRGNLTVAIEGGSGSGKTTLAALLNAVYGCTVFHMDDFFLRPAQRTAERYREIGGNIDRERFLEEVLIPLKEGAPVIYRKFDCHSLSLSAPISVTPKKLTLNEGAYSIHRGLQNYIDFSVFLDIDAALQKKRIEARNGDYASVLFEIWIPLETAYFEKTDIKNRCDLIIEI